MLMTRGGWVYGIVLPTWRFPKIGPQSSSISRWDFPEQKPSGLLRLRLPPRPVQARRIKVAPLASWGMVNRQASRKMPMINKLQYTFV